MNTEEFIKKAREVHGDRYDYSKTILTKSTNKICIVCPEHGEFWQNPYNHLNGHECPKCGYLKRWFIRKTTTEEFIKRAKEIHGDKYDYSKVEYKNPTTKVCIICPEHGEFWQTPNAHLNKQGCPKCGKKLKLTTEEFIKKAREIHGNKYDYSKINYINNRTPICIICPEHGEFWQTPKNHLRGQGCKKCTKFHKLTTEEFIKRAKEIHGNRYDYSKANYTGTHNKICIICPEHGEFWQTPYYHLKGFGCKECNKYFLEKEISNILIDNKIKFEYNKTFEWLKYKKNMYVDFYLPENNIIIECQGEQHLIKERKFDIVKESDKDCLKRDVKKNFLCLERGIKIIYFSYTNLNKIDENKDLYLNNPYFTNKFKLIEYIKSKNKEK